MRPPKLDRQPAVWRGPRADALGPGLEYGCALHELTFGFFLLVIVLIPFRAGQRWAWWACWIALIATLGYSLTFAHYDATTLAYSLVPAVGIPVLPITQAPRFWATGR